MESRKRSNLGNKLQRQGLLVWNLNGALVCFIRRKPAGECRHRGIACIKADVASVCRKMDQIALVPKSWHSPRNTFLRFGQRGAKHMINLLEKRLRFLRLQRNVFGNRFRRIAAVVRLVLLFEGAPAP